MRNDLTFKQLAAEALGTGLLVLVGVGVATESFGFRLVRSSFSIGVVATALAFGLVLLVLAYTFGPTSGCHVNPAVTAGFVASGRMKLSAAIGYWIAQFVGAILGALLLWGMFNQSPNYHQVRTGLGANGWDTASRLHVSGGGAFLTEVVLTFAFVLVVLVVTTKGWTSPPAAPLAIGLALTAVHLIGIPITGTSVNPARSLGPALILGGQAIRQVWLFIVAPLTGGILAALAARLVTSNGSEAATPSEP